MGLGLTVKHEVHLTKADSAALARASRIKRRSQSSIIREALVEWLTTQGFVREEDEVEASPRPTLKELLETERQKKSLGSPSAREVLSLQLQSVARPSKP
jgi:hypothetical protein